MEVETLGIARSLGWKVHMRCANGYRLETKVYAHTIAKAWPDPKIAGRATPVVRSA
jgi:hypothetical protein